MDYLTFNREIDKGIIHSVYLFTGEEDFLAETGVKAIIDKILNPEDRALNLVVFYGMDADGLPEALSALPVFAARRVTIVRQAGDLKGKNLDAVINYLKAPPEDGCLILWADKVDKRKSFFRDIGGKISPVNCGKLRAKQLSSWMKDYVGRWDKMLDSEAMGKLSAINWPSLRELAGELERLTLLVGDKEVIKLNDVDELGEASFAFERWALTDAVGSGDVKTAQKAVKNLQDWNTKPVQIIWELYRLFHRLWLINWFVRKRKLAEAKNAIDLHPFVFKKYIGYARKIDRKTLEDGILRISEADLNVKRGLRQPDQEINLLVLELAQAIRGGSG